MTNMIVQRPLWWNYFALYIRVSKKWKVRTKRNGTNQVYPLLHLLRNSAQYRIKYNIRFSCLNDSKNHKFSNFIRVHTVRDKNTDRCVFLSGLSSFSLHFHIISLQRSESKCVCLTAGRVYLSVYLYIFFLSSWLENIKFFYWKNLTRHSNSFLSTLFYGFEFKVRLEHLWNVCFSSNGFCCFYFCSISFIFSFFPLSASRVEPTFISNYMRLPPSAISCPSTYFTTYPRMNECNLVQPFSRRQHATEKAESQRKTEGKQNKNTHTRI